MFYTTKDPVHNNDANTSGCRGAFVAFFLLCWVPPTKANGTGQVVCEKLFIGGLISAVCWNINVLIFSFERGNPLTTRVKMKTVTNNKCCCWDPLWPLSCGCNKDRSGYWSADVPDGVEMQNQAFWLTVDAPKDLVDAARKVVGNCVAVATAASGVSGIATAVATGGVGVIPVTAKAWWASFAACVQTGGYVAGIFSYHIVERNWWPGENWNPVSQ